MRTTKAISITLPSAMLESAQELARQENRTMSELVREALRTYQSKRRWDAINEFGRASAEQLGIHTEEDVVQLIHEFRKEQTDRKAQR